MNDTWHTAELKNQLKQIKQDALANSKTVFLSNPVQREELEKIIREYFYPALIRAVKNRPIKLTSGKEKDLVDNIEEEWHVHTTKSLTFLLEDPERPLVPHSNIHWFCSGKIECSVLEYMFHLDFQIYFPESFSMDNILSLLKDPAFVGLPPQLEYQNSIDGQQIYWIHMTNASYGEVQYNLTIGEKIIFSFGGILDNFANGWIRVIGNLIVDGDLNVSQNLNVAGNISGASPVKIVGGLDIKGNATIDNLEIQKRVSSNCAVGSSIRLIYTNGSVECEQDTDTDTTIVYTAFVQSIGNQIEVIVNMASLSDGYYIITSVPESYSVGSLGSIYKSGSTYYFTSLVPGALSWYQDGQYIVNSFGSGAGANYRITILRV